MMMAMNGSSCTPIVRVQWNDPVIIKRVLDIGAYGVLVPWVNRKEEAEAAVQACKYPPEGIRGWGPRRAERFDPDYRATANDEVLVSVQIETQKAVDNLDEIASVEGVDALFIGPYDLSNNMGFGIPPQWDNPRFLGAIEAVIHVCEEYGKAPGLYSNMEQHQVGRREGLHLQHRGRGGWFLSLRGRASPQEGTRGVASPNFLIRKAAELPELSSELIVMDTKESLNAIFNPKSVALIGATADSSKWGYMFVNAVKVGGYQGKVYPVNPKAAEIGSILDYKVYPSLSDVPDEVDCAIILVPAKVVPSVFDEMVEKKVKGAVVITSGFGETGEEGAKTHQQASKRKPRVTSASSAPTAWVSAAASPSSAPSWFPSSARKARSPSSARAEATAYSSSYAPTH